MGQHKNIFIGLLILIGIFGIAAFGRGKQASVSLQPNTTTATSTLTVTETVFDFGTISMAKGNVTHSFIITNLTSEDVFVESLTTSCMCTSAYMVNGTLRRGPFGMPGMAAVPRVNELIKAGETRAVDVVYNPAAHGPAGIGRIDRFIYLKDAKGDLLTLEIKAQVTP